MTRAALLLSLLVACTKAEDDAPEETGEPAPSWDCAADASPVLSTGVWNATTTEVVSLGCENSAGAGLHVDVGETNPMEITSVDGSCFTADVDGMEASGGHSGDTFEMIGFLEMEIGTCIVGIDALITGTMRSETSFDYEVDATASIEREASPDACSLIIGEEAWHTFPELPCDYGWKGEAEKE